MPGESCDAVDPAAEQAEINYGVPLFLDQLVLEPLTHLAWTPVLIWSVRGACGPSIDMKQIGRRGRIGAGVERRGRGRSGAVEAVMEFDPERAFE